MCLGVTPGLAVANESGVLRPRDSATSGRMGRMSHPVRSSGLQGMKILVIGATGRTGSHVVKLALARGHQVTAFVRSPDKIQQRDAALNVLRGDPLQAERLAAALSGQDAVISTLGPTGRDGFRRSTLVTECAASISAAMQSSGVRRLAIISAAPLFPSWNPLLVAFRWVLRNHLRDLVGMEAVVRASDFDWTIARPPRLVESGEEAYRAREGALPDGRLTMSFRAAGKFMLDCVEQQTHVRQVVGLAGPSRAG